MTTVVRTSAGWQFVIPGCERPKPTEKPRYSKDGNQFVIPGTEQIATRTLLQRLQSAPLRPKCGQRPLQQDGLFRATNNGR